MLSTALTTLHFISSLLGIVLILMQKEKGATAGAMGGASQTLFGSQGSGSFKARLTWALLVLFFSTNLVLSFFNPSQHDMLGITDTPPASSQGRSQNVQSTKE